jgi:hypothetical protein
VESRKAATSNDSSGSCSEWDDCILILDFLAVSPHDSVTQRDIYFVIIN